MNKKEIISMLADDSFLSKVEQLALRLRDLTQMEEKDQTHYTGADLNILEKIQENIENETLTQRDILEVEKLVFKFL